jgi:hypothetical protein
MGAERLAAEKAAETLAAENLLSRLCIGAELAGVRFALTFVILFEHLASLRSVSYDDIYLRIETNRTVFAEQPSDPKVALAIDGSELPLAGKLSLLSGLAGQSIRAVSIGTPHPHLSIVFESGAVLWVNGFNERFECWELGLIGSDKTYLVVAVPESRLAVWDADNKST